MSLERQLELCQTMRYPISMEFAEIDSVLSLEEMGSCLWELYLHFGD